MRKFKIPLPMLVFFIPVIILSIMVWKDYVSELDRIKENSTSLIGMYHLDDGSKLITLSDDRNGTWVQLQIYDTNTQSLLDEATIRANIHGIISSVSYQDGGIIIPTYDDSLGLQLHHVLDSGDIEELAKGTLQTPSYLTSGVNSWRGRIIVSGETQGSTPYMAQVRGGELEQVIFSSPDFLPARPESIGETIGGFNDDDHAVPLLELPLVDDRTAYVSGIFDTGELPEVMIKPAEGSSFEAADQASLKFARHFGMDSTKLIRVDGAYPEQARFYNEEAKEWGKAVPTPKPVYQAKVFPLNDQELLIAGSTTEDEVQGERIGYIYNETDESFIDASALISQLSYEDIADSEALFLKEGVDTPLYFSNSSLTSGWLNTKNEESQLLRFEEVEPWIVEASKANNSISGFWSYVKEGGPLIINLAIWLFIMLVILLVPTIILPILMKRRARNISRGSLLQGTVVQMQETGLYVNNQPQVKYVIRFTYDGEQRQTEVKKVVSFLQPLRVGDQVVISYNPKKNSAALITEQDVQHVEKPVTKEGILHRIEYVGYVQRGEVLKLHFNTEDEDYIIPVVQPTGFNYEPGVKARLFIAGGQAKIQSYGISNAGDRMESLLSLEAEVTGIQKIEVHNLGDVSLYLMELNLVNGQESLRKGNSVFVPNDVHVHKGMRISVQMNRRDYEHELKLSNAKKGAATVVTVTYEGYAVGDRPRALITVERGGETYEIRQSIEPIYGVAAGDELWIGYDDNTKEAIILNYSS
ncbi:hypothetical protein M3231_06700 [Neobacillus mesonae]|nr:hypothetical protein [Neobacillus mesonae]